MYDYVSQERLVNGLKWLKANNPLYADINIANNWLEDAIADDEELVMSMLAPAEPMDVDNSNSVCSNDHSNAISSNIHQSVSSDDLVSVCSQKLETST